MIYGLHSTPTIDLAGLEPGEKDFARTVSHALLTMALMTQRFHGIVQLYDHCERIAATYEAKIEAGARAGSGLKAWESGTQEERLARDWLNIAARDGVMCIYHFWQAMEAAKTTIRGCPTLHPRFLNERSRNATNLMKKHFPGRDSMRQAEAHSAELHRTPKETGKNSIDGPADIGGAVLLDKGATGVYASGTLDLSTRRYQTMHRGQVHFYNVTDNTLGNLEAIMVEFYAAFAAIDPWSRARGR